MKSASHNPQKPQTSELQFWQNSNLNLRTFQNQNFNSVPLLIFLIHSPFKL